MPTERVDHVVGVDPDRDRITIGIVDAATQGAVGSNSFPTTPRGYRAAIRWADTTTTSARRAWSIEGAGSYGAGLASVLSGAGEFVMLRAGGPARSSSGRRVPAR
jgi:transposase